MSEAPESFSAEMTQEAMASQQSEAAANSWRSVPFTALISALAVLFTLAYWAGMDVEFAFENAAIWKGQYWRFILSSFLHLDMLHLVFNVTAGWDLSAPLERHYGWRKMLLLFMLLAIGTGAAQFLTGDAGVGLSGVFYGYFGLILAAGKAPAGPRISLPPRDIVVILVWFVLCIAMSAAGEWNIGNASHAAGLIIGSAMGLALRTKRPRPWIVGIALGALALAPATLYMPWSYHWWMERSDRLAMKADQPGCVAALEQALAKAPDESSCYYAVLMLGSRHAQGGNLDAAVGYFRRAMESPLDQGQARAYTACIQMQRKDYKEARKLLLACDIAEAGGLADDPYFKAAMDWARGPLDAPPPDLEAETAPATSTAAAD